MLRPKDAIVVFGEGITEKYFFLSLRDILKFRPTPIKPKNSSLAEFENCIRDCLRNGYSRIFCLIDMDNKTEDGNPEHVRGAKEYDKLKRKYHQQRLANGAGDTSLGEMVESYPSTEIFFRYYFGYTSAPISNQQLKADLAKRFGYSTQEKYFIKHSLHEELVKAGGSLQQAIIASKRSVKCRAFGSNYTQLGDMIEQLL